ncbi:MAG: YlxR family protein [Firmicutes bacterium]|nr:YlxR family protein [Bacillota bacterium]
MVNKVLLRTCLACGKKEDKLKFIRINRTPKKNKNVDIKVIEIGKEIYLDGRSAYMCPDDLCLKKVRKSRKLDKNFNYKISDVVYDLIEKVMIKHQSAKYFNYKIKDVFSSKSTDNRSSFTQYQKPM